MTELLKFFLKEEWKGKHAAIGAFLYIFTAVLITYLSMQQLNPPEFSAVFWLTVIFTTLQGISGSFIRMRKGQFVFWQQLCRPVDFLAARLIASYLLMCVYTLFAYVVFSMMHGGPETGGPLFLLMTLATGLGISSVFTVSSSIAAKTDNPGMLLPVLTFPVLIPLILVGTRAGNKAIEQADLIVLLPDLAVILALDILVVTLGLILIRSIWKE